MFKDQVVWITGASSGIGEAITLEMAGEGARLVLSARREDELERVAAKASELGAKSVQILPLDVTDFDSLPACVASVVAENGRIDMLINNAGISQRALVKDMEMIAYRKIFEVNFFGQIALTREVMDVMFKQGSGHIAVTSSVSGKIGAAERAGYTATKHAVMGWFDSLRVELHQHNIKVTTIVPGYTNTPISFSALKGDGEPFEKVSKENAAGMDVTKCAKVIMKGFHKGKREINAGEGIEMWGSTLKFLLPKLLFKLTEKRAPRYDV